MGQAHALVNLVVVAFPFIGGLILAVVIRSAAVDPIGSAMLSVALYAPGCACFVIAKVSVIRSGHLVTFGSRSMRPRDRSLYRTGYVLMIAALTLTAGLLVTATR